MATITVVAGTNGAGKSSVAGEAIRGRGGRYFNPDELTRDLRAQQPEMPMNEANAAAWLEGKRLLEAAIRDGTDFTFETTLGGNTIKELLQQAISSGLEVKVWYVALASPELHIERVRQRVAKGGHDIPEANIRKRYDASRVNLIELMPGLAALRVYDNSADADPARGGPPNPKLLLNMRAAKIVSHCELTTAPQWVKPILMAAFKIDPSKDPRTGRTGRRG